ncbi:unnamed protein product [marine sediment metagenome]|uniref:Uncharacterized protein n=1 Tax=marine sediment metagenome TaxID=412755 RepID=X1JY43_9ZZZZ
MASGPISVKSIIGVIITLVIGLSLLPIVLSTVASASASLTGAAKTMIELIPLFYCIALALATVYWAIGKTGT